MSKEDMYDALMDHFGEWIFDFPKSETLKSMFKLRFTPEEAELLSQIPFLGHTLEQLTAKIDISIDKLKIMLDDFTNKGIIFRVERSSRTLYSLTDPLFVFYRTPSWDGEDNDFNRKMSPYLNKYFIDTFASDFMGHDTKGLRTIPINETIRDPRQVIPYEDVLKVVDNFEYYSVSACPCSLRHTLDPIFEDCKHDLERCLHFDTLGRYIVENGFGREITKEETLEILQKAADAGLVHGLSNTEKGPDTICNCCSCCCLFLESVVKMPGILPRGHQPSSYIREMDEEKCIGCGVCVRRCPMNALELKDKKVIFTPERCIGCGVCINKCPQDASCLEYRGENQDYPKNPRETAERFLKERGKEPMEVFKKNYWR